MIFLVEFTWRPFTPFKKYPFLRKEKIPRHTRVQHIALKEFFLHYYWRSGGPMNHGDKWILSKEVWKSRKTKKKIGKVGKIGNGGSPQPEGLITLLHHIVCFLDRTVGIYIVLVQDQNVHTLWWWLTIIVELADSPMTYLLLFAEWLRTLLSLYVHLLCTSDLFLTISDNITFHRKSLSTRT